MVSINRSDDNNNLPEQEELYLEETEEEVRAILTSGDQVPGRTKAEYWRGKIEGLELDWEVKIP